MESPNWIVLYEQLEVIARARRQGPNCEFQMLIAGEPWHNLILTPEQAAHWTKNLETVWSV
jgi:hypothetical protein